VFSPVASISQAGNAAAKAGRKNPPTNPSAPVMRMRRKLRSIWGWIEAADLIQRHEIHRRTKA
jgi:hypothetical protein